MKFSLVNVTFLVMVLCITRLFYPAINTQNSKNMVVAAYFTSWNGYGSNGYKIEDIYPVAKDLTHLIYAFAKPDVKTGTCTLLDPWADVGANFEYRTKVGGNFAALLELKKKFPHVKILLSIGGGKSSKDIAEIVKQGKSKLFAQSCVQLLDRYVYEYQHSKTGKQQKNIFEYPQLFDGIDLNWEWANNVVPDQEAKGYETLLYLFKEALKKRDEHRRQTSILTTALQVHPSVFNALPLQRVQTYVDWFHLMTYNFTGAVFSGVGFNAPISNPWSLLSIQNSVTGLLTSGIDPSKLVLGIPLYGHVFDKTDGKLGSSFQNTELSGPMSYEQIKSLYIQNDACEYKWHDKSQVPFVYCPNDKVFVSFDDVRSVQQKVVYAMQKGLKGIFFWKLSDDDSEHSLVKSVQAVL